MYELHDSIRSYDNSAPLSTFQVQSNYDNGESRSVRQRETMSGLKCKKIMSNLLFGRILTGNTDHYTERLSDFWTELKEKCALTKFTQPNYS